MDATDCVPCFSVYLDDGLLATRTWEEHLNGLRTVFERLRSANMTINLEKSDFGQARVQYLGHVIGLGKVAPVAAKLEDIRGYPEPHDDFWAWSATTADFVKIFNYQC